MIRLWENINKIRAKVHFSQNFNAATTNFLIFESGPRVQLGFPPLSKTSLDDHFTARLIYKWFIE